MKLETEGDFKAIPGLRWHLDEDGTPIAKAITAKLRKCHLYFHGPGKLGLYYEYPTEQATRFGRNYWKSKCRVFLPNLEQPGDFDGILIFKPEKLGDIPPVFFRCKRISNLPKKPRRSLESEVKTDAGGFNG